MISFFKTSKKLIYLDPGHGGFDGGCINNELSIIESLKIEYNDYNDKIKRFINLYGLEEINSTLSINMYITKHITFS